MLVHSTGATSWNKSLGRRPFFNPVLAPSAFWGGLIFVYNIYFAYSKTRGMQQAGTSILEDKPLMFPLYLYVKGVDQIRLSLLIAGPGRS